MTVAWVFPGQGSQVVGMGRDLYAQVPAARDIFDQADDVLDLNLARLCFEGPENDLTSTVNAQPALLTVSVALLRAIETMLPNGHTTGPQVVAGHSLGEYSALVAGGSMDFVTALRLVRRRGELMGASSRGSMAAIIGLDEQDIDRICAEVLAQTGGPLVIANYNAPGQFVISGACAAVEEAGKRAKEAKARRVVPLRVSGGFHSPLMDQATEGMAEAVGQSEIADPQVPLIANVTASVLHTADDVRQELIAQVMSPVRWIASVQHMVAQGISDFVEIGPGNVLTGLIKRIAPGARLVNVRNVEEVRAFAASCG